MSETTNTQIIKLAYEKFGVGDINGLLATFADDIQWNVPVIENAPFKSCKGKAAVAQFFQQLIEAENFEEFAPTDFIAQGDKVVVIGKATATVKSTGRRYSTPWVHIFTLRNGKVATFLEFLDTAATAKAFQKSATA